MASDSSVASAAPVTGLDHHADGNVGHHEALQIGRVHNVSNTSDNFLVLLIDFKHFFSALFVTFAEDLALEWDLIYVLDMVLNSLDTKG